MEDAMTPVPDDTDQPADDAAPESPPPRRGGIVLFDPPAAAPDLYDTGMMSMPTVDPPAPDQMMEWALSGGHIVKVLYRQGGENGMSLVCTTPTACTT
jgi:hypothetical protein